MALSSRHPTDTLDEASGNALQVHAGLSHTGALLSFSSMLADICVLYKARKPHKWHHFSRIYRHEKMKFCNIFYIVLNK